MVCGLFLEDLITHRSCAQQLVARAVALLHRRKRGRVDTGCDIAGCYIQLPAPVPMRAVDILRTHMRRIRMLRAAALILWSGPVFLGWVLLLQ
jgi:hypothetical protein